MTKIQLCNSKRIGSPFGSHIVFTTKLLISIGTSISEFHDNIVSIRKELIFKVIRVVELIPRESIICELS